MPTYHDKCSHLDFKICLKQSRLSIKLRGKISHACNRVITILTTTRRKQLQGTSCNLENFVMLTFCFSWLFYCNDRELCYFSNYTTFSSQKKNLEWDGQMLIMISWNNKTCNADERKFEFSMFFLLCWETSALNWSQPRSEPRERDWIEVSTSNRESSACLQSKSIFHYSLIDISISWSCFDKT